MDKSVSAILLFFCFVFSSCELFNGDPVAVVVDRSAGDSLPVQFHLVIDGDSTYRIPEDTTFVIRLTPGSHSLTTDEKTKQKFNVPDKGGILNLSNIEYVAFEVPYEAESKKRYAFDAENSRVRFPVMLDSVLVVPYQGKIKMFEDSDVVAILHFIRSKGYRDIMREEVISGLYKTGKNQLLVKKIWDYHMTEAMPASIREEKNTNELIGGSNYTYKTTVLRAEQFLLKALLDTSHYRVQMIPKELR